MSSRRPCVVPDLCPLPHSRRGSYRICFKVTSLHHESPGPMSGSRDRRTRLEVVVTYGHPDPRGPSVPTKGCPGGPPSSVGPTPFHRGGGSSSLPREVLGVVPDEDRGPLRGPQWPWRCLWLLKFVPEPPCRSSVLPRHQVSRPQVSEPHLLVAVCKEERAFVLRYPAPRTLPDQKPVK